MNPKLRVIIYGRDQDRLDHVEESFKTYSTIKILVTDSDFNRSMSEKNSLNKAIDLYSAIGTMFINADTMKKVNITGTESVLNIIDTVDRQIADREIPYIITFNRYNDHGYQTQYIKELVEGVSVFRSYHPSGSDCWYVTGKALEKIKKCPENTDYVSKIFSSVKQGDFDCFSFNPNLYTYRIEASDQDYSIQQSKTSIMKPDSKFSINDSVGRFFNTHLLLFWIFFVFFVCTMFVMIVRVFRIGKFLV